MRLKELREERNITQQQIAKAINTSQTNIGRWEKGTNEPASSYIILLANFFECSTDYLLGRSDDFGNVNVTQKNPPELSSEEKQLLDNFRSLPRQEKAQASEYVNYLAERRGNKQNKQAKHA